MADSLDEGLDALARTGVDARGAEQLSEELRLLGHRHADSLPESAGEVYRIVSATLAPAVASSVTRHLLEGAG